MFVFSAHHVLIGMSLDYNSKGGANISNFHILQMCTL